MGTHTKAAQSRPIKVRSILDILSNKQYVIACVESFPAPLLFCEATLLDSPWKEEGALKEPHSQTMMPYSKGTIRKGERILWPRQDERRGRSKEDRPTEGPRGDMDDEAKRGGGGERERVSNPFPSLKRASQSREEGFAKRIFFFLHFLFPSLFKW